MKNYIIAALLFISIPFGSFASEKIVAIVNNSPITLQELNDRKMLIAFISHIDASNPAESQKLQKTAMDSLIDEELLNQQKENFGLEIAESDIDNGVRNIEKQNNMPDGGLATLLSKNGINISSFRKKIASDLLKYKIMAEVITPDVKITSSQLESVILSQNYKDASVVLKILTSKDSSSASHKEMRTLSKRIRGCDLSGVKYDSFATLEDVDTKFSKLDPKIKTTVINLPVGKCSSVLMLDDRFKILVLCSKKMDAFNQKEGDYLSNVLINKKVAIKLKKYQIELRQRAYIKIL
ncbi:MAG: SurA N-terminal domain-containing protein [Rickettsiaceae bacterium]|nr:SurA N-terminal domain-containing protein [Rickettsiaceae bacterium]